MNTNPEIFLNVVGTVLMLTAIPALWVSGRILLRNLRSKDRSTQLFLWLVLGGFFNIPLVDILSNPANLIAQAIPSDQTELPVRIGTTSIILNLIIYALAIFYGQRIIAKHNLPFMNELNLTSLERGLYCVGAGWPIQSRGSRNSNQFYFVGIYSRNDQLESEQDA